MSEPPHVPDRDGRRPRSVYGGGDEPDVRFSMANERTALAWLRTALSVVAAGVGLTTLARWSGGGAALDAVAALLCLLGAALAAGAWVGWRRRERAMRLGAPLPPPLGLAWLAAALAAVAAVLAVTTLAHAL